MKPEINMDEIFPEERSVSEEKFKEVAPNLYKAVMERLKEDLFTNKHGIQFCRDRAACMVSAYHKPTMLLHKFDILYSWNMTDFENMTVEQLKEYCTKKN